MARVPAGAPDGRLIATALSGADLVASEFTRSASTGTIIPPHIAPVACGAVGAAVFADEKSGTRPAARGAPCTRKLSLVPLPVIGVTRYPPTSRGVPASAEAGAWGAAPGVPGRAWRVAWTEEKS